MLLIFLFYLQFYSSFSLNTSIEWKWISGDKDIITGSSSSIPGPRYGSLSFSINDLNYIFGGVDQNNDFYNHIYSFSNDYNEWVSVYDKESPNSSGSYNNGNSPYPGSRYGGCSWYNNDEGLLLIFGGESYNGGFHDDLWSYQPSIDQWDWIYGNPNTNRPVNYNSGNIGSRKGSLSWIYDDKLYLFGGSHYQGGNIVYKGDLWTYNLNNILLYLNGDDINLESMKWDYISGTESSNMLGNHGELLESSILFHPSTRCCSITWIDKEDNILWLFGGFSLINNDNIYTETYFNDVWSYNINTQEWTWVSGDPNGNNEGFYGEKLVSSSDNLPPSRSGSISWYDDKNKILYLYGGYYKDNDGNEYHYNDLWRFNINDLTWTWISGNNSANVNGIYSEEKGIPSVDIYPGSRHSSVSWFDESDNTFYLFGGFGYASFKEGEDNKGVLNDLWSFTISEVSDTPSPSPSNLLPSPHESIICNTTSCYIDDSIIVEETIIITDNLIISNKSTIYISDLSIGRVIVNKGDKSIIIHGGKVILNIDKSLYDEILDNNQSYELVLIDGKYEGNFDRIDIENEDDNKRCERLMPNNDKNDQLTIYKITFSIDKSSCNKFSWWKILLIIIGSFIFIIAILIMILYINKPLRRKILPFR